MRSLFRRELTATVELMGKVLPFGAVTLSRVWVRVAEMWSLTLFFCNKSLSKTFFFFPTFVLLVVYLFVYCNLRLTQRVVRVEGRRCQRHTCDESSCEDTVKWLVRA